MIGLIYVIYAQKRKKIHTIMMNKTATSIVIYKKAGRSVNRPAIREST